MPSSSPDDPPGSAMLTNTSDRAVVARSLVWRYQDVNGNTRTGGRTSHSVILPGHQHQCTDSGWRPTTALASITLMIDGAFFADAEFVGPGRYGLWETVTCKSGIRSEAAQAAKSAQSRGVPAADILEEIGKITGSATSRPAPPPHPGPMTPRKLEQIIAKAQNTFAREIDWHRRSTGDERTVDWLASMANTPLPDYRKRVTS